MRTALAITHVAFEDLGTLGVELTDSDFNIEIIDACTADLRAIDAIGSDLLVVLGGPIGVYDRDSYPFIDAEIELLSSRLAAQKPTLGICLGAQLMAAALGARVYPGNRGKELGWAPIYTTSDCCLPSWFRPLLRPALRVLHWHGDTFDLPDGAKRLAETADYANQAFVVGNFALALQFHPEVTVRGLERWYVGHASELAQAGIRVGHLRAESRTFGPELEIVAREIWRQWLAQLFPSNREPGTGSSDESSERSSPVR
jgi:GMP synthase (glutamine-hydrolysing)